MPEKLRTKLTANQFYCVGCNKRSTAKTADICVVTMKNGTPALKGHCSSCESDAYKFIKHTTVKEAVKKYGKC